MEVKLTDVSIGARLPVEAEGLVDCCNAVVVNGPDYDA